MPVASTLKDRQAAVLLGADKAFAETVRLSFLTRDHAADPARPAAEVRGVLRVGGGKETNAAGGFAQDWASRLAAGKAELHLDARAYAGPPIRTSDRVRAIDRPGKPWFEVLRVDDRGETRLVLELGEV